jgi:hypothetical protein
LNETLIYRLLFCVKICSVLYPLPFCLTVSFRLIIRLPRFLLPFGVQSHTCLSNFLLSVLLVCSFYFIQLLVNLFTCPLSQSSLKTKDDLFVVPTFVCNATIFFDTIHTVNTVTQQAQDQGAAHPNGAQSSLSSKK